MQDKMVYDGNTGGEGSTTSWEERLKNWERGFLGATTQICKKIPIIEEVPAQNFRDAKDVMSVFPCNFFQSLPSKF